MRACLLLLLPALALPALDAPPPPAVPPVFKASGGQRLPAELRTSSFTWDSIHPVDGCHLVVSWHEDYRMLSLVFMRFAKASEPGESLALAEQARNPSTDRDLNVTTAFLADDKVAFVGSHWSDFTAGVGRLED